jgi:hypothetical protein
MRAVALSLTVLLIAVVVIADAPGAHAAEVIDQDTGTTSGMAQGLGGWKYLAQSFVPTKGAITKVELWLDRDGSPPSSLYFYLRSDTSSDNIASVPIDPSNIPADPQTGQWFSITMPSGTTLSAGSKYWLVLYAADYSIGPPTNDVVWFYANNNYANGSAYITGNSSPAWPPTGNWSLLKSGNYDLAFRTHIDDGWSDVDTSTTVSEDTDPINCPPTATTVKATVTAGADKVPGGKVTLSVSPKQGTFGGGGSGPVTLDVSDGEASTTWTPPVSPARRRPTPSAAAMAPTATAAPRRTTSRAAIATP